MRLIFILLCVITINCQNVNQNSTAHHFLPLGAGGGQGGSEEESEYDEDHHPHLHQTNSNSNNGQHEYEEIILGNGSGGKTYMEPPLTSGGTDSHSSSSSSSSSSTISRSRIIETKYGKVQGLSLTLAHQWRNSNSNNNGPLKNTIVEVYVGIPYASPPIKSHRFGPTQTAMPWEGVRDAVKPGFVCPQMLPDIRNETAALKEMPRGYLEYLKKVEPYLRNQSEDCLYLNIYTPIGPEPKVRPVVVYIHGGKFSWGSGNLSDGTVMAAYGDVVFVSLNYRLNVLGFLNVHAIPNGKPRVANYGLMDQIAALHWIKENILKFGGDPENITLMGYEAGAACINYLMVSPAVTPGLFHRTILIAGSAHAPWALVSDPTAAASALAQSLNCTIPSSNSSLPTPAPYVSKTASSQKEDPIFECIKNKHFSEFSGFPKPKFSVDFGPSIDGVVIKPNFRASQSQMGKRDVAKKYDVLLGLSSLEKMTAFSENDLQSGFEGQRRDAILRTLIRNSYHYHLSEILATIINEYTDWEKSSQHPIPTRDLTVNAVTDCLALAPVIAVSESRQVNRAFFYVFEHATKDGLYNYVSSTGQRTGGVGGEELLYLLGTPLIDSLTSTVLPFIPPPAPSNYTKGEMALSEQLITFLSNFAHTGDPNEPLKGELVWPISKERNRYKNIPWEQHDRLHQKYLEISANKIRGRTHYRAHQMAIWLRLVPELQRSGAQFASGLHNRMKGGNDPSLYVGKLRHPLDGEDPLLHAPSLSLLDIMGYSRGEEMLDSDQEGGSTGNLSANQQNPPAPPTTCFSPLASSSSPAVGAVERLNNNSTGGTKGIVEPTFPLFSSYSTALSVTIAVGCSLLILNVFILAIVYYQRDKRMRVDMSKANSNNSHQGQHHHHGSHHHHQGCHGHHHPGGKYHGGSNEPPELLKSNSTTCSSLHHVAISTSPTPNDHLTAQRQLVHQGSNDSNKGDYGSPQQQQQQLAQQALAQRGILLSPTQAQATHSHQAFHHGQQMCAYSTLPRSNGGVGMALPKPPPPPRTFTQNFSSTLPHNQRSSNQNLNYPGNFDELKV